MSRKSLQDNAPGETRTPNLLIRSQSLASRITRAIVERLQEAAKQGPKTDTGSHNNSHNTYHGVSQLSRVPGATK